MNAADLPPITVAQRIDAAFVAILAGRFNAPEVLDVMWGCVGDPQAYQQLRAERGWRMQIEESAEAAADEVRRVAARARAEFTRRFDALQAAVAAARRIA